MLCGRHLPRLKSSFLQNDVFVGVVVTAMMIGQIQFSAWATQAMFLSQPITMKVFLLLMNCETPY